jgi:CBS domain-containing protein
VAVGIARTPVPRQSPDGESWQAARIILLVLAPPRAAAAYLQTVGAFARLLSRAGVPELMLAQPDAESLAALPVLREIEIRDQLAVRDLMTLRPRTVRPDTPLRDAALDMVRAGVGGLPVVDDGDRVIGMLSERELMHHLMSNYLQPGAAQRALGATGKPRTVRDVMTRQVLCVSPEQPLAEVAAMLTNKDVDRVPVVREGRLVGFLTRGDIVRKLIGS